MNDIDTLEDVKFMVDTIYTAIKTDKELSNILKKLSKKNWKIDIQKMYDFWEKLLFGTGEYADSPFVDTIPILIEEKYFDFWVSLFHKMIDNNFKGANADIAKSRATAMAKLYQNKLKYVKPKRVRRTKEEMERDLKEHN